jgi:hypothetical protein
MDSWGKSAVVGRIAGPVSWVIAGLCALIFGIVIPEETIGKMSEAVTQVIYGFCMVWGIFAPIYSKWKEKKAVKGQVSSDG